MVSDRPTLLTLNSSARDDLILSQIIDLIADTLGIHVSPQYQDSLEKTILTRIKALELASFQDYYQYLITQEQLLFGAAEWQELISLISITESYFFRDQGQFGLLKNQILPEIIERKRQLNLPGAINSQRSRLRLWSAGCSTGEEAYSLAILLQELIPDHRAWDIVILGTDINQPALELAQQGIYSDWSFRIVDPVIKTRYFRSHRKGWEIDPRIRQMVSFQPGNLLQDPYPNYTSKLCDLDLILCRNVFIYFNFKAIAQVLEKFYRSLAPGGFLLTGHTELHGQKIAPFHVTSFPQSVIYQRHSPLSQKDKSPLLTLAASSEKRRIADPSFSPPKERLELRKNTQQILLGEAKRSPTLAVDADAPQTAKQLIPLAPLDFQAYCLSAEAYANLGLYTCAIQSCQQALQINPLAIEPYYLLAQVAEEQGDIDSAKSFLKRIIYLVPSSVSAYLELGSIYEREGNIKQAQRTWRSILKVLQNLPRQQAISSSNGQTVAELEEYIFKHSGMKLND